LRGNGQSPFASYSDFLFNPRSRITSTTGQQPLIPHDWAIDRACDTGNLYTVDDDLRHTLMIQKFSARVSYLMSDNRQNPTGQPTEVDIALIMALLERDLEDMTKQVEESLSGIYNPQHPHVTKRL
jgi:hypothetical protein